MPVKTKRSKIKAKTKAELNMVEAEQAFAKARQDFAIAKSIFKANTAYDKASEAQRRVMIAEDALHQLKVRRFVATPGTYVDATDLAEEAKLKDDIQLNTLLHNPALKSPCDVCARGALLLSAVKFRNDVTIDPEGGTSEESFVREFQDNDQLYIIEHAFEDEAYEDDGQSWAEKHLSSKERKDPDKRLELILKNIIRNKGTFKANQR